MATENLPFVDLDENPTLPFVDLDEDQVSPKPAADYSKLEFVDLDEEPTPQIKPSVPIVDRVTSRAVANPTPWEQPTMGPGRAPMGIAERVGRAIREAASPVIGKTPEQALREAQEIRAMSADSQPISDSEIERRYTKTVTNPDGTTYETLNPDRLKSPVTSAIGRGVDQMQDAAYGLAQWAATIAGVETPTLDEWRKANQKEISDNPPVSPGAAYALNRGGLGNLATLAIESASEALPQGIPSMGAGAVAGRLASSAAGKATMQAAGAALPNIGQAIGGIFGDAVDSGKRDREAALTATTYGVASGLLDTIGDVLFLNKAGAGMDTALKRKLTADVLKTPSGAAFVAYGVKNLGEEGLKQMVSESSTEELQTALEQSARIATDNRGQEEYWTKWAQKMISPDFQAERLQARVAGGFGGAGMGMASTVPGIAGEFLQMSAGTRALNEINEILKEGKMGTPVDPAPRPEATQVQPVIPAGMTPEQAIAANVPSGAPAIGVPIGTSSPVPRNEPDADSGLREALAQEASNSPVDLLRRANRSNANNQAARRAALEAGLTAPSEPLYEKPAPAPEEVVPVARVAPTPDTDRGLAEVPSARPVESPVDALRREARRQAQFPPLDPQIQTVIDTLDNRIAAVGTGPSGDPANGEFTRSMHAAAINALKVLDNRILGGIDAGIPDVTLDPILAQRERIAAWEENNRPPGTTGATVAAALAQARPAPQISVPGASGPAIAEAQSVVPAPLAPVAVSAAPPVAPAPIPAPAPVPSMMAPPAPVTAPPAPSAPSPGSADVAAAINRQSGVTVPQGAEVKMTVSKSDREKAKRQAEKEAKALAKSKGELELSETKAKIKQRTESVNALFKAAPKLEQAFADYLQSARSAIQSKAPTDVQAQDDLYQKVSDAMYSFVGNQGQDAFRQGEAGQLVFQPSGFSLKKILDTGMASYVKSKKSATSTGRTVSLDQEVGEEGGSTLGDIVADPTANPETPDEKAHPIRDEIVKLTADRLLGGRVATPEELELITNGVHVIINDALYGGLGGVKVNEKSTGTDLMAWAKKHKAEVLGHFKAYSLWAGETKGIGLKQLMLMMRDEFTGGDLNLTGDGQGMFVEDVNDAIVGMLGSIPEYVRVVNDPLLVNSAGQPIKGVFIGRAGGEATITINAANHTNHLDVAVTLLHEAVHAVWDSPYVRAAAAKLERSMAGELPGYSQEQIREELAVRAITDRWANQQQRTLWRQLVDAIYAAIRRTFGMKPTDAQLMDIIAAEAIRFLNGSVESNRVTMRLSTGLGRDMSALGVYTNINQVNAALATPGLSTQQQDGIRSVAGAISALVPQVFVDQMQKAAAVVIDPAWPASARAMAKAQRSAAKMLLKIADLGNLAGTPVDVAGIPVESKFVAAHAVLEIRERIAHHMASLQRSMENAMAQMNAAATQAARVTPLNAKVAAADALTKLLLDATSNAIAAQEKLAPSLTAQQKAAVDAIKKNLGLIKFHAPTSVGPALQSIASVMPPGADPVRFLRVQQSTGWPAWGSPATAPMTSTVFDFLAGSMPITGPSAGPLTGFGLWTPGALEGMTDAIERLRKLQEDKAHAEQVVANVAALFKSMGAITSTKPTLKAFAKLYSDLRTKRSEMFEQASDIMAEVKRATERLDAVTAAVNMLEAIQESDSHKRQVEESAKLMDSSRKRTDGPNPMVIHDHRDGEYIVTDPITREYVHLKVSTDPEALRKNGERAASLLTNIEAYLDKRDTDPSTAETYRRLLPGLRNIWLGNANIASLTGQVDPVFFTKEYFMKLPAQLAGSFLGIPNKVMQGGNLILGNVFGNVIGRDLIYGMLGQQIGQTLNKYMTRSDWMANVVRAAMDSPVFGAWAHKKAMLNRVKQLGVNNQVSYGEAISAYSRDVLDHIYALGGNLAARQAYVGMYSPRGTILTKEDFAIAKMGKQYNDYLLQQMQKKAGGAIAEAPLATEDEFYFRNAVDVGMKMKRRRSDWGHVFSPEWKAAMEKDMATGAPGFSGNRMALLDDPENFIEAVNNTVATTDPSWKSSDKVQAAAMANRMASTVKWTFANMEDFLDWMSKERAAVINRLAGTPTTTEAEQRPLAEQYLLKDLDDAVKAVLSTESGDTESDSRVAGAGQATITALGGRSSFTEPRGNMIAPNGFYAYSIALDEDRLMLNAAAQRVFQVMELHALQNVIKALNAELLELGEKRKKFINSSSAYRWQSKREFNKQEVNNVLAGKATTTMRALTRVLTHLRSAEKGITNAIQQARADEGAILRVFRKFEQSLVISKLLSMPVAFTNFLGGVYVAPLMASMARNRMRYSIMAGLWSITKSTGYVARNVMDSLTTLTFKNRAMRDMLNRHKGGWMGMADFFLKGILRRQADVDYLDSIGVQPPVPFFQSLGRWFYETFPLGKTGGTITEREGTWTEGVSNWIMSPFSLTATMAGWLNQKTDFFSLRTQVGIHQMMLETLRADAYTAFEMREKMNPTGFATAPLMPFTPEEIGETSISGLNYLRDMFSPAGGLEPIMLNYYLRVKEALRAGKIKSPRDLPLLEPAVERDVVMHIMAKGNIINDSGKGEGLKGRGWAGLARSIGFRFFQYGAMFSGTLGQAMHRDIREPSGIQLRHAATMVGFIAVLAILAGLNLAGGQALRELQTGKVASAPTLTALMQDEGLTAAAKVFYLGGANLFMPAMGDLFSSMITGNAPRNPTDMAAMIPGIGVAASAMKWAQGVFQTGDVYYPTVALLKQQNPLVEPIFNRIQGAGAQDMDLINAARSYRSASPSSMELRQVGGGNIRMSPDTVLVRDAMKAAALNDQETFDDIVKQAMSQAEAAGRDPMAARSKLLASLKSKTPERSVYGRELTEPERAEVMARMTGGQAESVAKAGEITARVAAWAKTAPGGLTNRKMKSYGRSRRGGIKYRRFLGSRKKTPKKRGLKPVRV